MSRPIRYQPGDWSTVFVTGRCIHSRFLLTPSPRVNSLINGILERGCTRYAVRLHAMCFMSNHYHLLLSSQDALHGATQILSAMGATQILSATR